ncbi:hypothetical protein QCA50_018190 [Cerrena zonata]|uniref:Phosducin thioredoxin-like domain-containing protein n=1 Tax=Cerrena zonata TaxID=2478898 RepID=A0AAW0FI91_9APHY
MSMNDFKIPVEVDPTEDTEWNDILREKGIIPERPPSPTQQLEEALEEAVRNQHENRLESKDLDELDELEDEEDEAFLNEYKFKRLAELKKLSERKKFGTVFHINKPEYEKEVTLASNENQPLATKFPELKFVDIPANRCVENYPESNCPTLLIYLNKDVVKQFITLTQLGGNDTKLKDLEQVLINVNAINENDKRLLINHLDDDLEDDRRLRFMKKSIRENDSDDDFD